MTNRMPLVALALLAACAKAPVSRAETNNPDISVDMLVTI